MKWNALDCSNRYALTRHVEIFTRAQNVVAYSTNLATVHWDEFLRRAAT